jgi:hypothetical protein
MRLGFLCEPTNNAYYRAIIPMRALERRGHTVLWPSRFGEDVPMRELLGCDLVHCYRRTQRIEDLRTLSRRGVAVTFDNDDNYAAAQVSEGGEGLAGNRYNRQKFRELLKVAALADLTTTPSDVLAEIYRQAGVESVAVIENHLERSMPGFDAPSRHEGIVLGWVAGREHSVDLQRVPVMGALERLLEAHETLRVVSVGLRLPLASDRYEHIPRVALPQLLKITSAIDIGIAPLADIAFNHSRSNVKLKEYASGGAAWLASPVGPYVGHGDKQGGRLVADGDWYEAIDSLIANPRQRKRLARHAVKWAKRQAIDHHAQAWESAFLAATSRVG